MQGDDDNGEADYDGHGDMHQGGTHEGQVAADSELEGLMTVSDGAVDVEGQQDSGMEVEEAVNVEDEMEWEAPAEVDSGEKTEWESNLEGKDDAELVGQHGTGKADDGYDVVDSMQAVEGGSVVEMSAADEPQEELQVQGKGKGWGGAGMEGEAGLAMEARSEEMMEAANELVMEGRSEAVTRPDISTEVATAADEHYHKFSTVEVALIAAGLSAFAVTGVSLCCGLAAGRLAEAATCMAVEHVSGSVKVRRWKMSHCFPLSVDMVWHRLVANDRCTSMH